MRTTTLVAMGLVLASALGPAAGAGERPARKKAAASVTIVPSTDAIVGTVTYDTGVNAGFHPDVSAGSPNLNRFAGNRFNSVLGGPLLMTLMLTKITVFPANDGNQSVSVFGTPNSMNSAVLIDFQAADLMANLFNSILLAPAATVNADFLAVFLGSFNASQPLGLVGMSDMATMGQGYHAIQGFYFIGMATMVEPVPNRNAMVRATVDMLPVELMDFRIQ